ncbi:MAG: hypothetical protein ACE5HE_13485 [Phycisphaerae bacterium]
MARELWGRVAVGTRVVGCVPAEFLVSWTHLLLSGLRPGDAVLPFPIRAYHHAAANELVRYARKAGADSLLFVDSDQVFRHDALAKMRDNKYSQEFDVVMGLIVRRKTCDPIIMRAAGYDGERPLYEYVGEWQHGHVVPVDCLGLGFTLVRMAVFDRLSEPWFSFPAESDAVGEDVWFSHKARAAGLRLAVDTSVEVGHLVVEPLTASSVRRARGTEVGDADAA